MHTNLFWHCKIVCVCERERLRLWAVYAQVRGSLHRCRGHWRTLGILLYCSLPCFLETGPLTEPGAGLAARKSPPSSCLTPHSAGVIGTGSQAWLLKKLHLYLFIWGVALHLKVREHYLWQFSLYHVVLGIKLRSWVLAPGPSPAGQSGQPVMVNLDYPLDWI